MSYSPRDFHQRRLKQIVKNIDNNLAYIQEFEETYRPKHPDLADNALSLAAVLMAVQEGVQELSRSF